MAPVTVKSRTDILADGHQLAFPTQDAQFGDDLKPIGAVGLSGAEDPVREPPSGRGPRLRGVVAEVSEALSGAQAAVLAEYRGLSVAQMTELRRQAREAGVFLRVVKNTLARRAVEGSDFAILVTEPTTFGLHDLVKAVELIEMMKIPYGVIINRYDGYSFMDQYLEEHDILCLGHVPFSRNAARLYSEGYLLIEDDRYKTCFMTIKRNLEDVLEGPNHRGLPRHRKSQSSLAQIVRKRLPQSSEEISDHLFRVS